MDCAQQGEEILSTDHSLEMWYFVQQVYTSKKFRMAPAKHKKRYLQNNVTKVNTCTKIMWKQVCTKGEKANILEKQIGGEGNFCIHAKINNLYSPHRPCL